MWTTVTSFLARNLLFTIDVCQFGCSRQRLPIRNVSCSTVRTGNMLLTGKAKKMTGTAADRLDSPCPHLRPGSAWRTDFHPYFRPFYYISSSGSTGKQRTFEPKSDLASANGRVRPSRAGDVILDITGTSSLSFGQHFCCGPMKQEGASND